MSDKNLDAIQDDFIRHWGSLGSSWGVNRTLTQIHALLMVSDQAMTTDQIMERLKISRGNAHGNLKELVSWGIVRVEIVPGDRKDYFSSEKDPWKMLCLLARERQRRELEPAINALDECLSAASGLKGNEAKQFNDQLSELREFLEMASSVLGRLSRSERSHVLKWLVKMI